jgi:hypothetical protein
VFLLAKRTGPDAEDDPEPPDPALPTSAAAQEPLIQKVQS